MSPTRAPVRRSRWITAMLVTSVLASACGGERGTDDGEIRNDAGPGDTVDGLEPSDLDDTIPEGDPPSDPTSTAAPPHSADDVATSGGSVRVALDAESTGWRPQDDIWGHAGNIVARAVFDTLTVYDASGLPVPFLAASVDGNEDATVWRITLRPGIRFHDGTPLDATALRINFEAVLASPVSSASLAQLDSMELLDDLTLELTMSEPWSAFPSALSGGFAGQLGYIAAPTMLDDPDGSRNPIGTGPFRFDRWSPDDRLVVVRNDDYWLDPPLLDRVEFRPLPDAAGRRRAFDNDDVDIYYTASAPHVLDYREREQRGEISVISAPPSDPDVILLNTRTAPLDDLRVRRALAAAIDVDRVIDFIGGTGVTEAATGPYPPGSFWYTPTAYPTFDLDEAADLVDQYSAEHGPVRLRYLGGQDPFVVAYQELLQSMWADAGIDVEITSRSQAELISSVFSGEFDLVGWGGIGGDDPDDDYEFFRSGTGLDLTGFAHPEFDSALDAGRRSTDRHQRKREYDVVQQLLAEHLPFLWINYTHWNVVAGPGVHGIDAVTLPDGGPARPLTGPRFSLAGVFTSR